MHFSKTYSNRLILYNFTVGIVNALSTSESIFEIQKIDSKARPVYKIRIVNKTYKSNKPADNGDHSIHTERWNFWGMSIYNIFG